ncbi:MAG: aldehyde reductase [Bauldia sp.]|nr:aldehyde reductase [Bauldia sp.]
MAAGETILVTGARGFIAKHCIVALLERGYGVVGTLRDPSDEAEVRAAVATKVDAGDRLRFAKAELTSDAGWDDAMRGVRHVLHVASPYPLNQPRDVNEVVRPAREGTLRVLTAARAAGVKRVVLTSSVAAIASARYDRTRFDESDWSDVSSLGINAYALSKTLAERAAWDFVADGKGPELAVINAGQVFGPPLDANVQTSGEMIENFLRGKYPIVARFGLPVADVRDVAAAHVAAMEKPEAAGQRFIVADAFLWFADIGRIIGEALPAYRRKMPKGELPNVVSRLVVPFRPDMRAVKGDLGRVWEVDSEKAKSVLGITIRPAREAVVAMAEALIRFGRVS